MRSSSQTHMHHMTNAWALVVQQAASHVFQKDMWKKRRGETLHARLQDGPSESWRSISELPASFTPEAFGSVTASSWAVLCSVR